jgi:arylsulfatase A-like enzyme
MHTMKKVLLTVLAIAITCTADAADKPNLVFILADDLGYGDLGCYGCPDIHTPNLDRLAKQGVRFTDAYSSGSVCSPTRAAFITGRYQQRIGLEWAVYYDVPQEGLPHQETSLATMLRKAGYFTAMSGKWHLGYGDWNPTRHGFDRFFGMLGGNVHYFEHYGRKGTPDLWLDEQPIKRTGYITDLVAQHAVQFIDEAAERPFFLYVPFNAPHFPFQGPGDGERKVTPKQGWQTGDRATYAAMGESLDANVGRIVDAIDSRGLAGNTLIVFTSDNGGDVHSRNAPLSGGKGKLSEGGIRVPCIARWTGRIPAGKVTSQAAITMDFSATFLALARAGAPKDRPLDGADLMPVLEGHRQPFERTLFWRRALDPWRKNVVPQRAVRQGHWKYIDYPDGNQQLFNLATDIEEKNNLINTRPELAATLRQKLNAWEADIDPPLYDQRTAAAKKRAR